MDSMRLPTGDKRQLLLSLKITLPILEKKVTNTKTKKTIAQNYIR